MYDAYAAEYDLAVRDNVYNAKFERSFPRTIPALIFKIRPRGTILQQNRLLKFGKCSEGRSPLPSIEDL